MSFTNARKFYQSPEIVKRFDFVEAFNSCESVQSNAGAEKLAKKYGKVMTGGSDSHKPGCVGRGYTILPPDPQKDRLQSGRYSLREDDKRADRQDQQAPRVFLLGI